MIPVCVHIFNVTDFCLVQHAFRIACFSASSRPCELTGINTHLIVARPISAGIIRESGSRFRASLSLIPQSKVQRVIRRINVPIIGLFQIETRWCAGYAFGTFCGIFCWDLSTRNTGCGTNPHTRFTTLSPSPSPSRTGCLYLLHASFVVTVGWE